MRPLKEFWLAVHAYSRVFAFNNSHQLWKYYTLPFLLSVLVYVLLAVFFWFLGGKIVTSLENVLSPYLVLEQRWLQWLSWFLKLLLRVLILLFYYKIYRYFMLILLAPALALLAEKVQIILRNKENQSDFRQIMHDFLRSLSLTFYCLFYELSISFSLIALSFFIPVLSLVFAVAIFLNEAYFVGLSMLDYRSEFMRMSAKDTQKLAKKHWAVCMGNGLVCNLGMFVPLVGVTMPLLAVVASALAMEDLEN